MVDKKDSDRAECLLLDLDWTCICAIPMDQLDTVKNPEKFPVYKDFEKTYRIYERPYLQQFLDKAFKKYKVAVWTAAGISYANFVIDNFILTKPNRKLEFVMWSDHCDVSEERYDHQKKLKMLDFYGMKMVILDDNDEVLDTQSRKSVDSRAFDITQEETGDDDFLFMTALKEIQQKFDKMK